MYLGQDGAAASGGPTLPVCFVSATLAVTAPSTTIAVATSTTDIHSSSTDAKPPYTATELETSTNKPGVGGLCIGLETASTGPGDRAYQVGLPGTGIGYTITRTGNLMTDIPSGIVSVTAGPSAGPFGSRSVWHFNGTAVGAELEVADVEIIPRIQTEWTVKAEFAQRENSAGMLHQSMFRKGSSSKMSCPFSSLI